MEGEKYRQHPAKPQVWRLANGELYTEIEAKRITFS